MIKRSLWIGGVVTVLLGLLWGQSYVFTTWGMMKQSVKNSVPVDFELKRARQMIKDLQPEIEKNMYLIAREETEVAKLERQLARAEEQLADDREDILRLKDDLDSGSESFVYAGRAYTAKQVKTDLEHRFNQYKTKEATLEAKRKVLAARQRSLLAARDKLEGMLAARRQLQVDVENLEARLKMVEVAQTTSDFNFDDSRLARTRELIEEIGDRIEVAERLVNSDVQLSGSIPLDEPEAEQDVTEEITEYFEGRPADADSLVLH